MHGNIVIKFLWFEDMMDNLPKAIEAIAEFTNYEASKTNFVFFTSGIPTCVN